MQRYSRNNLLRSIFELAERHGVDRSAILAEINLDPALAAELGAFVPSEKIIDAVEFAAVATQRNDFGLCLGSFNDHRTLGPVGVLVENCNTVAEAVAEGSRYLHLHNSALLYTLTPDQNRYAFRLQLDARGKYPPRHYVEALLTMFIRFCRLVIDDTWHPLLIQFEHEKVADGAAYWRTFGCDVMFGQKRNQVSVPFADFDQPIAKSNPRIKELVQQLLTDLDRQQAESLKTRIVSLLRPLLASGDATAPKIAELLSLPPRTLQRRLAEQGTSFQEILIETRCKLVEEFLMRPGMTVSELAPILGLSEVSAASRFIRRNFKQSANLIKRRTSQGGAATGGS